MRHILALCPREWLLNIRAKVIVLLSAVFLVFALVEWCVGEMLLLPRFEQIERDNAATAMKRMEAGSGAGTGWPASVGQRLGQLGRHLSIHAGP